VQISTAAPAVAWPGAAFDSYLQWIDGRLVAERGFIARAARFFHYAIAIASSTSDDMLKILCAPARPPQPY
jgi:hypothetical protein